MLSCLSEMDARATTNLCFCTEKYHADLLFQEFEHLAKSNVIVTNKSETTNGVPPCLVLSCLLADICRNRKNVRASKEQRRSQDSEEFLSRFSKLVSCKSLQCCFENQSIIREDPAVRQKLLVFVYKVSKRDSFTCRIERESIKVLIFEGLTDTWSATRKLCSKLLVDMISDLGETQKLFFHDIILSLNRVLGIGDSSTTTWQDIEGALGAITKCVKANNKFDLITASMDKSICSNCLELLCHSQLSIREHAISCLIALTSKNITREKVTDLYLSVLTTLYQSNTDAYHAESLLGLIEKLLNLYMQIDEKQQLALEIGHRTSLFGYLLSSMIGHEASSVRQKCSLVLSQIALTDSSQVEYTSELLVKLANTTVSHNWKATECWLLTIDEILQNPNLLSQSSLTPLEDKAYTVLLGNALHQAIMGISSPQFEVKRISLQLFPLLVKKISLHKPDLLLNHIWRSPSQIAAMTFKIAASEYELFSLNPYNNKEHDIRENMDSIPTVAQSKSDKYTDLRKALQAALPVINSFFLESCRKSIYSIQEAMTAHLAVEALLLAYARIDISQWEHGDVQLEQFLAFHRVFSFVVSHEFKTQRACFYKADKPLSESCMSHSDTNILQKMTLGTLKSMQFDNTEKPWISSISNLIPRFFEIFPLKYCLKLCPPLIKMCRFSEYSTDSLLVLTAADVCISKGKFLLENDLQHCEQIVMHLVEIGTSLKELVGNCRSMEVIEKAISQLLVLSEMDSSCCKTVLETFIILENTFFLSKVDQRKISTNRRNDGHIDTKEVIKQNKNVGKLETERNPIALASTDMNDDESDWDEDSDDEAEELNFDAILNLFRSLFRNNHSDTQKETVIERIISILQKHEIMDEFSPNSIEILGNIYSSAFYN